jgi:hypothetical protein
MAVNTEITVMWDVTPSSLADTYHRFGGTSCTHFLTQLHCIACSVSSAQLKPGKVREFNPVRTLIIIIIIIIIIVEG